MQVMPLRAHFDGEKILLDEPFPLEPDTKLLVTVLPKTDAEREAWLKLSSRRLQEAYGDDEPEYAVSSVRVVNPSYERG